jgi:hypothetical protein
LGKREKLKPLPLTLSLSPLGRGRGEGKFQMCSARIRIYDFLNVVRILERRILDDRVYE